MFDESESLALASDRELQGGTQRELAAARLELAARDKTIRVLIARVEGQLARRQSPVAVLEQNISLEQKVQRRTRELEQSHESLSRTLLELKLVQSQLLEAHMLEAVGQLAAGVAHEINIPVQYVADNAGFLKDAAIARSVVVGRHGGTIRFESETGVGTCFYVRLPLTDCGVGAPQVIA